jgi:hypothetical protein
MLLEPVRCLPPRDTQNHTCFLTEIPPACRVLVGYLATTNKSRSNPVLGTENNAEDPHSIRNRYRICQPDNRVPADRTLYPPDGIDFSGQWNCGDGASIAHLEVENRNRSTGGAPLRLPGPRTEVRESQEGFNGNYFVGYDRDKSQFVMIDADDPASVAYFTEGWNGKGSCSHRQMTKVN